MKREVKAEQVPQIYDFSFSSSSFVFCLIKLPQIEGSHHIHLDSPERVLPHIIDFLNNKAVNKCSKEAKPQKIDSKEKEDESFNTVLL